MASRTIRAPLNFIGFHQLQPFLPLIGRWLPFHVDNLIARPNETFGLTMAFHTPFHVKRRDLPGERHLIDAPVAGGAADPFLHMDAVIEVNKFRKIMDTVPCQWFARAQTFADGFEHRTVYPDLVVAVHANSCGRNACKR